jgi:hypothetical protein
MRPPTVIPPQIYTPRPGTVKCLLCNKKFDSPDKRTFRLCNICRKRRTTENPGWELYAAI